MMCLQAAMQSDSCAEPNCYQLCDLNICC